MSKFGDDRRVRIRARYIAALLPFLSKENWRYYLNGIHIEPHQDGGIVAAATDGHTLAAIYDAGGESNGAWICDIPRIIAAACRKRPAKSPRQRIKIPGDVHFIGQVAYVMADGFSDADAIDVGHLAVAYAPPIDGRFPDWRLVVPTGPNSEAQPTVPPFNPALLQRFKDAADILLPRGLNSVRIIPTGDRSPAVVYISNVPEFFGLMMPMTADPAPAQPPAWAVPKKEASRAA